VEFLGVGAEGGQYQFSLGLVETSDDQRELTFRVSPQAAAEGWTAYEVADRLLSLADSNSSDYRPVWAGLMASAAVRSIDVVRVELRRPYVLPAAWLCTPLAPGQASSVPVKGEESAMGYGQFYVAEQSETASRFRPRSASSGAVLAEIIEIPFDDSRRATAALKKGDVDIVDRMFPADAARLLRDLTPGGPFAVESYALPTVHMLVVNEDNPYLANSDFRRALVYGIDRAAILRDELLGGEELPACRVLSGPFPAGTGDRDPLAYAYDNSLEARPYSPQLAKFLVVLARDQVGSQGVAWRPLSIGYPPYETARVACHAIASQLAIIGVECELREIPFSDAIANDEALDLQYAEVTMREPLVDVHQLFGDRGIWPTANPSVRRALRKLEQAQGWPEVREALLWVHRSVYDESTIVPLWQTAEYFAFNRRVRNVGESPLALYQNIDEWRLRNSTLQK
jgi:ABC-type transport system substrate-binding protein